MAIAYSSAGDGAATESNGADLTPACPAAVGAGDILIAHIVVLDATSALSTPDGWELLFGPSGLGTGTPTGRAWAYGKIAAGTEDGATVNFGSLASTVGRLGRIYSFSGYVSGTITDVVPAASFAENSSEQDPVIQSVTTTIAGAKAVALVSQDDDNAHDALGAVVGGTWAEPVADYINTTVGAQGACLQLQVGTPTSDPGTIAGGTVAGANDEANTLCFEIRPSVPAELHSGDFALTGGGVGTPAASTGRSGPVTATGGGAASTAASSQRSGDHALTGGGVVVVDYEVASGGEPHSGDFALTGGGAVAVVASGARASGVALTGGGAVAAGSLAARPGSFALTGGGVVVNAGQKAAGLGLGATGGGLATIGETTARQGSPSASGGGIIAAAWTGAHAGSASASGGGVVSVEGTSADSREGDFALTGGGLVGVEAVAAEAAPAVPIGASLRYVRVIVRRDGSFHASGSGQVRILGVAEWSDDDLFLEMLESVA